MESKREVVSTHDIYLHVAGIVHYKESLLSVYQGCLSDRSGAEDYTRELTGYLIPACGEHLDIKRSSVCELKG